VGLLVFSMQVPARASRSGTVIQNGLNISKLLESFGNHTFQNRKDSRMGYCPQMGNASLDTGILLNIRKSLNIC
jgi:hypothetical protein